MRVVGDNRFYSGVVNHVTEEILTEFVVGRLIFGAHVWHRDSWEISGILFHVFDIIVSWNTKHAMSATKTERHLNLFRFAIIIR